MGVRKGKKDTPAPPPPPPSPKYAALACHEFVGGDDPHGHINAHPESPDRVAACVERLRSNGLLRSFRRLASRSATDDELQLCHTPSHIIGLAELARLARNDRKPRFAPSNGPLCSNGPSCEVHEGNQQADTYINGGSLDAARLAVGGLLQLVDEAMLASTSPQHPSCGIALCRPPGHHASRARSSGFCLVNNIAIAAAYAKATYPEIKRVLIFDWDVHHGQGTQQIFETDADVLTLDMHRYDGKEFYPTTGGPREVGTGPGRGFTVNVALPAGYGDAAIWAASVEVLAPAARQFHPDLILVSAGFDAAEGDPLGGCMVSPRFFGVLTHELRRLAAELSHGRLIFALEGGYNTSVLAECVEEVSKALVNPPVEGVAFSEAPDWLEGSAYYGAIRRTCEAHEKLPLKLKPPLSQNQRKKAALPPSPVLQPSSDQSVPEIGKAMANQDQPPINVVVLVEPGELIVHMTSIPKPTDVAVSVSELRVWFGAALRSWQFEGVQVDNSEALRIAEFRPKRQQLTLHLALGPILGGSVGLKEIAV